MLKTERPQDKEEIIHIVTFKPGLRVFLWEQSIPFILVQILCDQLRDTSFRQVMFAMQACI